jgi:hypothetical protein
VSQHTKAGTQSGEAPQQQQPAVLAISPDEALAVAIAFQRGQKLEAVTGFSPFNIETQAHLLNIIQRAGLSALVA